MTIQKQQPTHQSHPNMEEALSGNPAAGELAQKAAALMEQLMGSTVTPRLSELPTKEARLNAVADAIERQELVKHGLGFNMNTWFSNSDERDRDRKNNMHGTECGTVACIAGWTTALDFRDGGKEGKGLTSALDDTRYFGSISDKAKNILGIDDPTAYELFTPWARFGIDITPARAIAVIRNVAKTGKVEWGKFDDTGKEV